MSCDLLTLGRSIPCEGTIGGISGLFFINYGNIVPVFNATNPEVIDDLGTGLTAYYYEIKSASNLIQTLTGSADNNNVFIEQVITAVLSKIEYATNHELKLMAFGRPQVVVQFKSGQSFVVGLENGAQLITGVADSGTAAADANGYTLTLNATELSYANSLLGATRYNPAATDGTTGPFVGLTNAVTIVDGLAITPTPPTV